MENPGFISEMIAALQSQLRRSPRVVAAAIQPAPPLSSATAAPMIRPTARERAAIDLHRQEWP